MLRISKASEEIGFVLNEILSAFAMHAGTHPSSKTRSLNLSPEGSRVGESIHL